MRRQKLLELDQKLETVIREAERIAKATKDSANELSHAAVASPSTSGDREHATNAANINQEKLTKLLILKNEVGEATNKEVPGTINPVCYFNEYYLVTNPMYIEGFKLISPQSPLGKAVIGKRVGETYEYKNDAGQTISGRVSAIE